MEKIDLTNLMPTESTFKLSQFKDIEFKLMPCTGGKLISMTQLFGNVEKMLAMPDAATVSKLAMSLMDFESAKTFKKQKVITIDLDGNEKEENIGGYILLANAITGLSEQWGIYKAILISFGFQKERADEIIKDLSDGLNKLVNDQLKGDVKKKKKKANR